MIKTIIRMIIISTTGMHHTPDIFFTISEIRLFSVFFYLTDIRSVFI